MKAYIDIKTKDEITRNSEDLPYGNGIWSNFGTEIIILHLQGCQLARREANAPAEDSGQETKPRLERKIYMARLIDIYVDIDWKIYRLMIDR